MVHENADTAPSSSEYVPAWQRLHVPLLLAPTVELKVPAGQNEHCIAFTVLLYCPAGHRLHPVPELLIADPIIHEKVSWQDAIPTESVVVPAGQAAHAELLYPEAYDPMAHSRNEKLPLVFVNDPGDVKTHDVLVDEPVLGL